MDEEPDDRITQLVDALTDGERHRLLSGGTDPDGKATGYLPPIDRLDVPSFSLVDGPAGVRIPDAPATAFPAPIAPGRSSKRIWEPMIPEPSAPSANSSVSRRSTSITVE